MLPDWLIDLLIFKYLAGDKETVLHECDNCGLPWPPLLVTFELP